MKLWLHVDLTHVQNINLSSASVHLGTHQRKMPVILPLRSPRSTVLCPYSFFFLHFVPPSYFHNKSALGLKCSGKVIKTHFLLGAQKSRDTQKKSGGGNSYEENKGTNAAKAMYASTNKWGNSSKLSCFGCTARNTKK